MYLYLIMKKMFHEITLKRLNVKFFLKKEYYVSNSSHPNCDYQILATQIIPGNKTKHFFNLFKNNISCEFNGYKTSYNSII